MAAVSGPVEPAIRPDTLLPDIRRPLDALEAELEKDRQGQPANLTAELYLDALVAHNKLALYHFTLALNERVARLIDVETFDAKDVRLLSRSAGLRSEALRGLGLDAEADEAKKFADLLKVIADRMDA